MPREKQNASDTAKRKPKQAADRLPEIKASKAQTIKARTPEEARRVIAQSAISPELAATRAIQATEGNKGIGEYLDTPELIQCLYEQAAAVHRGDMAVAEAMLMNQATALQSIFSRLAERGMGCNTNPAFEINMRMALRAQSQCRATLETLAFIKNPASVSFVRQANIAAGPQQVNNAIGEGSRAREIESKQGKLLEAQNGKRLDPGAKGATGAANPQLETVGAIHRPKDRSG